MTPQRNPNLPRDGSPKSASHGSVEKRLNEKDEVRQRDREDPSEVLRRLAAGDMPELERLAGELLLQTVGPLRVWKERSGSGGQLITGDAGICGGRAQHG